MPRPPRDIEPGIHHIGSGASGPDLYYRDDTDRAAWLRLFVKTILRHEWSVIVVVELTTHWHAIVQTHDHSLADGMQFLNGEYSRTFNERHIRVGYLVRDRYWSRRKSTDASLINAYCYVANNPVLSGLVRRAEEWRWSSHASAVGLGDAFSFVDASPVLVHFGSTTEQARTALRRRIDALAGALTEGS